MLQAEATKSLSDNPWVIGGVVAGLSVFVLILDRVIKLVRALKNTDSNKAELKGDRELTAGEMSKDYWRMEIRKALDEKLVPLFDSFAKTLDRQSEILDKIVDIQHQQNETLNRVIGLQETTLQLVKVKTANAGG